MLNYMKITKEEMDLFIIGSLIYLSFYNEQASYLHERLLG